MASLPTKQQAIAQIASVVQAPVSKLVRTLAETYTKLVRVVNAVAEQKNQNSDRYFIVNFLFRSNYYGFK